LIVVAWICRSELRPSNKNCWIYLWIKNRKWFSRPCDQYIMFFQREMDKFVNGFERNDHLSNFFRRWSHDHSMSQLNSHKKFPVGDENWIPQKRPTKSDFFATRISTHIYKVSGVREKAGHIHKKPPTFREDYPCLWIWGFIDKWPRGVCVWGGWFMDISLIYRCLGGFVKKGSYL
jgi:hypothetical protein